MSKQVLEYNVYPKINTLSNEEKEQKELNVYANFCVDFVNMLSNALNLKITEKESILDKKTYITKVYEIDMPRLTKQIEKEIPRKIIKPLPISSLAARGVNKNV